MPKNWDKCRPKYLDPPTKLENDKKEYRLIKLSNSLEALLIFDENLTCTLKSDEQKAACGLCINVGRLSDPKICPGITRFLEASLFRQLDEHILNNINLEDFISSNNGTKDVSIDSEHTTFYFEIDNKALVRALDCFAQFFIKPMITKSSLEMQQETIRNALTCYAYTEFQMALFNGNLRYEQLFSSFAQIGHPVHKISSDNIIKMRNELDSENLHNVLLKFKERHYSAHRMKLVIQSRLSLDALEEFVIKFFANIPTNKLHPENFMRFKDVLPFDTPAFRKMYKVHDSMESLTQLKITWALPLLHDFNYYKYKPDQYISWIIEYKGKGSLINYLRKKKWCPTYNMFHCNYERNSLYSSIQLTMKLTHEGRKHLEDVLNAIFSFINLLKKEGPQKEIYNDILQSKHNYFRFKDYKKEPISHVKKLCKNMHIYPSESYLTGELHFDFNSELIQESLNNLVPEMTNIMIFSKNIDLLELDQFDPCWMTEYKDIEIPKKWIKHWKVIEPLPEIFLPLPNIFLTREFSVIPLPKKVPKYPIKLYSDPVSEIWYCPDSKFRTPKCYVCFHFITPLKLQSVKNGVLMGMYCDVLKELITEELYPAEQAGFKYNIDVGEIGFTLQISGFRPTMPLLLNLLASNMVKLPEYITEDLFQSIKTQQIELYNIGIKKPEILIKDMLLSILKLVHYSQVDMLTALHNITLKDFEEFVISFTDYLYIQCLVQGNVIQIDAFNLVQQFIKTINPMPLHSSATQYLRSIQIPLGTSYYKIKNVNKLDATSLVLNHYQVGIKSIESFMLIKLLMFIIYNEFCNKKLFVDKFKCVTNTYIDVNGILGYNIMVCTLANEYKTEYADLIIEDFLEQFKCKCLESLTENDLDDYKQKIIRSELRDAISLEEEVDKNWRQITQRKYMFDRRDKKILALMEINVNKLKEWFAKQTMNGSNFRKLSVHVIGTDPKKAQYVDLEYIKDVEQYEPIKYHYITTVENYRKKFSLGSIINM